MFTFELLGVLPMTISVLIILFCLLFLLFSLTLNWFKPPITFLIITSVICLSGITQPEQALDIIANEQIAVILMLMILGNVLRKSILVDRLFKTLFKDNTSEKGFIAKLYISIGSLSAFFNNTPLVAIVIPHLSKWGERNNISPSKLLLPLSYASIIGGGITLIGTSANLIVNKMYIDYGGEGMELFDFSIIGLPIFIVGFIYILLSSQLLKPRVNYENSNSQHYLIECHIKNGSGIVNKSILEAGLRDLENFFLVEIIRDNKTILAKPESILLDTDRLMFSGDSSKAIELIETHPYLELNNTSSEISDKQEIIEVVIPYNSSLVGKLVKESDFRRRFDAAIIGVRRNGKNLSGKIGALKIQSGDLFLCVTGNRFNEYASKGNDIYSVNKVEELKTIGMKSSYLVLGGMFLAMILAGFKITSLFNSILIMLTILAGSKLVPFEDIKKSFNYNFLLIGGGALVFGDAMAKTGLAEIIANYSIKTFSQFGEIGTLIGIFLITNILASYMTNIAAIAIIYPVAVIVSNNMGIPLFWTSMMVAFGGSKIFLTPIGYQTNLMVFGPGGYKPIDFLRYGGGLLILTTITIFFTLLVFY